MTSSLWPYEDVQFTFKDDSLTLTTPWARRQIKLEPAQLLDLEQLLLRRDEIPVSLQRNTYTRLFWSHRAAPFFYLLPRKKDTLAVNQAPPVRPLPDDLIANEVSLRGTELPAALRAKIAYRDWDVEGILKFARVEHTDAYDPLSIFTLCRRLYALDSMEFDQTRRLYEDALKFRGTPMFTKAAHLIGYQNYEVTRRCHEILSPALSLGNAEARGLLQDFIRAEDGHDRLLAEALKGFTFQEKPDPRVLPITDLLLNCFRRVSQANLLAFSLTVAFFEESSPDGKDPYAEFLHAGGEKAPAGLFERHHQVNETGHHDSIGLRLAETMPAVSEDYARQTIQATETISKVLNHLTANLILEIEAMAARDADVPTGHGPDPRA